jgi:hypothetical protein
MNGIPLKSAIRHTRSPPASIRRRTAAVVLAALDPGFFWLVVMKGIIARGRLQVKFFCCKT